MTAYSTTKFGVLGFSEGRREELEQKRAELKEQLNALVVEANRDNIPSAWRR